MTAGLVGVFPTAHLAHVGGFLGGIALAGAFVLFNVVESGEILVRRASP